MAAATLVLEADGGSRGNPGPAAYGAVVRDGDTGEVLAEAAEAIGVATNNVAEYRGLIAGLELARQVAPQSPLEARMDSKLVIEQMAGRWKVKHPDLQPLAAQAERLLPADVTWTWIPRERNTAADGLLNQILDGGPPVWRITAPPEPAEPPGPAAGTVLLLHTAPGPAAAVAVGPLESLGQVRVLRDRLLREYAGETMQAAADPWTVALLVTYVIGGSAEMAGRLEVGPGTVTEVVWYPDGRGALRRFSAPS